MGYVKNINAHILATKNFNQIAVIIYGMDKDNNTEPSIIYNIIKGVSRYAKGKGYCEAQLLCGILNQNQQEKTIVVPCEMIIRDSL